MNAFLSKITDPTMRALTLAVLVAGDAVEAYSDGATYGVTDGGYQLGRDYRNAQTALSNYRSGVAR